MGRHVETSGEPAQPALGASPADQSHLHVQTFAPQRRRSAQDPVLSLPGHEPADASDHHRGLPGRVSRTEPRIDACTDQVDRAAGEPLHAPAGESGDGEERVRPAQRPLEQLTQPRHDGRNRDLGPMAHDRISDSEFSTQPRSQHRQRMRGTEHDRIGPEALRLGDDPASDPASRPHEATAVAHDVARPAIVARSQHPHLAVEGGGQAGEILLDAAGLRRVVVGDEQDLHAKGRL